MTVPELHTTTTESYTPAPETRDLEWVFDISGWMDKNIVRLKNHIYPHSFKFFRGGDGKARMIYKNWAQDKTWKPDDAPIIVLPNLPVGTPTLIRPSLGGKETTSIADLRSKLRSSSHRMDDDQHQWWDNFISQEEERRKHWSEMGESEIQELSSQHWYLKKLKKYNAKRETEPEGPQRHDEELERLLAKENSFPPVSIDQRFTTKASNKRHPVSHSWKALPNTLFLDPYKTSKG